MRRIRRAVAVVFLAAGFGGAQTAVEYTLGVGRAAGSGAAAGKQAGGVFAKAGKKLEQATATAEKGESRVVTIPRTADPDASKPRPAFEDPKGIREGLSAEALVKRFGAAIFKTAGADGASKQVYANADSEFSVVVKDGKVESVTRTPKPEQAGVVVLK